MKRKVVILILFTFLINFFVKGQNFTPITQTEGVITVKELQKAKKKQLRKVHPFAQKALQRGEKKGEFKNVSYKLMPNVKMLTKVQKNQINIQKDGILKINKALGQFSPSSNYIYMDPSSDLIFQSSPINKNEMLLLRPKLYDVFEDIKIPLQEVKLTLANTSTTAPNIKMHSTKKNNDYAVHLKFDNITYVLDSTKNSRITTTLDGEITLTNPRVEARYSKNGGYKLLFKTSERIDLRTKTNVRFSEEKKILLWGTEIPVAKIGKCKLGVFAVISVDGNISLVVDVNQGIDVCLGAKGSTFYYVPTSMHNISTLKHFCEVDYEIKAKMKAFAGVECKALLKFKSYKILDLYVKGGMEGTVESDTKTLSADVGVRLKAGAKVVKKKFTVIDKYFSLWKLQTPDMAGYKMNILEVCAFGDYVVGKVQKTQDGEHYDNYKGELKVVVKHPQGSINKYNGRCNNNGLFLVSNIPLRKGDKVAIQIAGVNNLSSFMDASIPFKEINLTAVDYFTNTAYGSVSASVSKWFKMAKQPSKALSNQITSTINQSKVPVNIGNFSNRKIVDKIAKLRANLVEYNGRVQFLIRSPKSSLSSKGFSHKKVGHINSDFLGFFKVKNLDFKPNELVKAVIKIDGFTVSSKWVKTDGLLVSEIINENFKMTSGIKKKTFKADNSIVSVSAIRSDRCPSGKVGILQGVSMPHTSIANSQPIAEFPKAKNGIIFTNKLVKLVPSNKKDGISIAKTGAWSVAVYPPQFSNFNPVSIPPKDGKHPFESVSYIFKNSKIGYKYLEDKCPTCTSPLNLIEYLKFKNIHSQEKIHNEMNKIQKIIPKTNLKRKRVRGRI